MCYTVGEFLFTEVTLDNLIVIASGGTGGHVFPAVCLADELTKRGYGIVFATDKRGVKYLGKYADKAIIQNISTSSRLKLFLSLIFNIFKYFFKIICLKPKMVIGFGGYPSVPFVLTAQILGIKTVIHEQNAVIGKANDLLSRKATMIATSFPKTTGLSFGEKSKCVGNPTRFEASYDTVEKPENDVFTILIFGGSQGAKVFSEVVVDAICEFSKTRIVKVFHQGRKQDIARIKQAYSLAGIDSVVQEFFDNIDELYQQSDIVISRSGASSIFEIIGFQKPAILIPYGNSINGDQLENAKFLENHKACVVIQEKELTKTKLVETLINIPPKMQKISENLKLLRICAPVKKFADYIEKTIQ